MLRSVKLQLLACYLFGSLASSLLVTFKAVSMSQWLQVSDPLFRPLIVFPGRREGTSGGQVVGPFQEADVSFVAGR